jgi:hypothetical protein
MVRHPAMKMGGGGIETQLHAVIIPVQEKAKEKFGRHTERCIETIFMFLSSQHYFEQV